MARTDGTTRENRSSPTLIRWRKSELERIRAGAAARRISMSELIRTAALEAARAALLADR